MSKDDTKTEAHKEAVAEHEATKKELTEVQDSIRDHLDALRTLQSRRQTLNKLESTQEFKVARTQVDAQEFEIGHWYQREDLSWSTRNQSKTKELSSNPNELVYVVGSKCPRKHTTLTLYHLQLAKVEGDWTPSGREPSTPCGWYTSFISISQQKMRSRTEVWHKLPNGSKLEMIIKGGVSVERLLEICQETYEDTKPHRITCQLAGVDMGTWYYKDQHCKRTLKYHQAWRFITQFEALEEEETADLFQKKGVWHRGDPIGMIITIGNSKGHQQPLVQPERGEWFGLYPCHVVNPGSTDSMEGR